MDTAFHAPGRRESAWLHGTMRSILHVVIADDGRIVNAVPAACGGVGVRTRTMVPVTIHRRMTQAMCGWMLRNLFAGGPLPPDSEAYRAWVPPLVTLSDDDTCHLFVSGDMPHLGRVLGRHADILTGDGLDTGSGPGTFRRRLSVGAVQAGAGMMDCADFSMGEFIHQSDGVADTTADDIAGRVHPASVVRMVPGLPTPQAYFRAAIGNPFRPVTVDPAWLTGDVRQLVAALHNDLDAETAGAMADALEEADCCCEGVLMPLRGAQQAVLPGCDCDGTTYRRGGVSETSCVCGGTSAWTGPTLPPFRGMHVLEELREAVAAAGRRAVA